MKIAFLVLLGAFVTIAAIFVIWLAWMNRASERVITAIIAAAIALIGAPVAVLVFGGDQPVSAVFPVAFLYQADSKLPANLPWSMSHRRFLPSSLAPAELFKQDPNSFNDEKDKLGIELYHHLLQRSLIDWLGYGGGWQTEILRFELPFGRQERSSRAPNSTGPSLTLSREQIQALLKGNKFAAVSVPFGGDLIALPPATTLQITPPTEKTGSGVVGEVILENSFCRIVIQTQNSMWLRSLGQYRFLAGMPLDDSQKFATSTYVVRLTASFSRLRAGHPDMTKYRDWVKQVTEGLRDQFDEQTIWRRTREDFILSKQLGISDQDSGI
jgi:hypothetical protein